MTETLCLRRITGPGTSSELDTWRHVVTTILMGDDDAASWTAPPTRTHGIFFGHTRDVVHPPLPLLRNFSVGTPLKRVSSQP
jgi:hypothetical protein